MTLDPFKVSCSHLIKYIFWEEKMFGNSHSPASKCVQNKRKSIKKKKCSFSGAHSRFSNSRVLGQGLRIYIKNSPLVDPSTSSPQAIL